MSSVPGVDRRVESRDVDLPVPDSAFRHEALLYTGHEEFLREAAAFVRDGLASREPVLVVVESVRLNALRDRLGADADAVSFADMAEVGSNPARIIPAWKRFLAAHPRATRVRGIGEPVWAGRPPAELLECQHHEALLNVAFTDVDPLWLLCPYDVATLDPAVIETARRAHPVLSGHGRVAANPAFRAHASLDWPLPDPPATPSHPFGRGDLGWLRAFVRHEAMAAGLPSERSDDLVLAVNELATNSLRYGGGKGALQVWTDHGTVVCEVRDDGRIDQPLVGRVQPPTTGSSGRGLWMVNQLCDLVQLRSSVAGTVVRVHMAGPVAGALTASARRSSAGVGRRGPGL
jgi:anti-sigma regulatory factor (Ser/Thr protein kinase)